MFHVFQQYLTSKIALTAEQLTWVESLSTTRRLRKHQYLLQEGDVWKFHAFIAQGCLRSYTVDDKGIEHIIGFAIENWWIGDRESLLYGQPAKLNIDAVEDSTVILFSNDNFMAVCRQVPAFNDMVNTIIQRSFAASQNRIQAAISFTAEEKYANFLNRYPMLATRLPQQMIAAYLGITPETLSRVRKQLYKKA